MTTEPLGRKCLERRGALKWPLGLPKGARLVCLNWIGSIEADFAESVNVRLYL